MGEMRRLQAEGECEPFPLSKNPAVWRASAACPLNCSPCEIKCAVIAGVRDQSWQKLQRLLLTPAASSPGRSAELTRMSDQWARADRAFARVRIEADILRTVAAPSDGTGLDSRFP